MNWESIFNALDQSESFLAIILLVLAFVLGMIFIWVWLDGRIKDARKVLEVEQLKNSGLMGKNEELENEAKINLADANRIKIENRETVAQNESLLQEKDQSYSQVMALSQSETMLKDELSDLNSRYIIMETSRQKMSSSLTQVSSDFETSIAQKDALNSRIAELEATNQNLLETRIRENASYTTQLNSLQESLNHLQTEHTVGKNDLAAKIEELNGFGAKYLSMKNENGALASAHQNIVANLEAEKVKTREALEKLQAQENAPVITNDSNQSYAGFDDSNEVSLTVELNVVKKQLKAEHQSRIEQQQEADRWRASLITLKTDLAQAEEGRAKEQESFLNELAELKESHQGTLELKTQKLLKATTKVEGLEAKVTSLEAVANGDENDTVHLATSQSNLLDLENNKPATVDEVSTDIQALEAEHEQVIAVAKAQVDALNIQIERAEAKMSNLEATLNDAENDTIELEEKYAKILDIENDKFATAKDNIFSLESQVYLLEEKYIRLEATANDVENDSIEYEAKFERLLDMEHVKLSAAKDTNMSLMEQLAEAKIVQGTASAVEVVETNARIDANLEDGVMDSYQAIKTLKELIGTEIPAASAQKDNLKTIRGIGKHIEEGLNDLGINSYQQISHLTNSHVQAIRRALDIFPGRIEQDDWVGQAKGLYQDNDELTPETAKLEVQALLGGKIPMATAKDKDDLKLIKGVGGFLEKKLNDIGIYNFKQISKFDKDAIEKITIAIEFFPERIKHDKWVKQAKELM